MANLDRIFRVQQRPDRLQDLLPWKLLTCQAAILIAVAKGNIEGPVEICAKRDADQPGDSGIQGCRFRIDRQDLGLIEQFNHFNQLGSGSHDGKAVGGYRRCNIQSLQEAGKLQLLEDLEQQVVVRLPDRIIGKLAGNAHIIFETDQLPGKKGICLTGNKPLLHF
ncbi:MAG: hypothetical protein ACD_75C02531G0002 [uncultured bacterium]|nr:MAG: hypothetical protein ACD_75C02531G0002 [uncultured bacterium]